MASSMVSCSPSLKIDTRPMVVRCAISLGVGNGFMLSESIIAPTKRGGCTSGFTLSHRGLREIDIWRGLEDLSL